MKTKLNSRKDTHKMENKKIYPVAGIINFLILLSFFMTSMTYGDTQLELKGRIKQAKESELGILKDLDSSKITILDETLNVVAVSYANQSGQCKICLPFNSSFTLLVTKKGWLSKKIHVNTRVGKANNRSYSLVFNIDLCREIPGIDAGVLRQPVAKISFNEYINQFEFSSIQNQETLLGLKKLYSSYYQYYVNEEQRTNEQPERKANNQGVIYTVQIITLAGHLPANAKFFRNCGKAEEHIIDGKYCYTIGMFESANQAELKAEELRNRGYNSAFIVAFLDGKRMSINEVSQLLTNK